VHARLDENQAKLRVLKTKHKTKRGEKMV
jgi:hypothetical protein